MSDQAHSTLSLRETRYMLVRPGDGPGDERLLDETAYNAADL
ncbi:hypothetical protein [Pseudorhodoferax soli]|uniref:Uncharacterized protein n=1 Tax=Pseudorhodoferax soli TaxID=545864 RepID=A0A368XGW0_9BURK|nr:hypothetical protein [Pseudorhodoferax soli]RCW66258.1 hypothetical protein DES41_111216 [Pseudorhodoferax soli]